MFDFVFTADAESKKYARQLSGSAGVAVFVAQKSDSEHWVRVGQACRRFALQARARQSAGEVAQFRPELAALIGTPGRRPDIVMRFGLLMLAEIGFDIVLAGRTMVEHFAIYRQPSYAAGLTGQIAFAVIRFLQWQRSVLAPEQR
jgi:hypothetical protein